MKRVYIFLTVLGVAFLAAPLLSCNHTSESILSHSNEILLTDSIKYQVHKLIHLYPIKFKNIVYAQFLLESGHGTSNLCLTKNNLFGMKHPYKRMTTSIATSGYAEYTSIETCIIDFMIFQKYIKVNTEEEYIKYLSTYYATDTNYLKKIIKLLR